MTERNALTQPATGVLMHPAYAKAIATTAYVWGWPIVNQFNRRSGLSAAPAPGRLNGVVPLAPVGRLSMLNNYIEPDQTFITCPNQDVVYGASYYALENGPSVFQVPDFGDRFWVYAIYDARTDQFSSIGKPYGTKPGHYLLAGPDWKGDVPAGIVDVVRSPTALANLLPRVFMDDTDEDRAAIQPLINQIAAYPLAEYDGTMKITDWSMSPSFPGPTSEDGAETKWVLPEHFFDQLAGILDVVPPLPGEEALYAQYRLILDAAERDPAIKQALLDAAQEAETAVITPFFQWQHNGRPAGNGWNRSTNNARWGIDYFNRTGTSKSNMFDNKPEETQYFYSDNDGDGAPLKGSNSYEVTFPAGQEPPVEGFWSLTLYNEHHFFNPNPLNRYSLGTKNTSLKRGADGSLTIYAGATSPGADRESNWLPAPDGPFSLYIRAYWGKQAILDGSWQPPRIIRNG